MTFFDKLAWWCSWCAPLGLCVALVSILASFAFRGGSSPAGLVESIPGTALAAGVIAFVAHAILTIHVLTASFLTQAERSSLVRALYLRGAYGVWRATMRGQVPS